MVEREDGPFFEAAHRAAGEVDDSVGEERRRAWWRAVPRFAVALAEGFLRDWLLIGAVLFSLVVPVVGGTSGVVGWAVAGVVAGVVGVVLVGVAVRRKWSFGAQWAVILGVVVAQAAYLVLFWKTR